MGYLASFGRAYIYPCETVGGTIVRRVRPTVIGALTWSAVLLHYCTPDRMLFEVEAGLLNLSEREEQSGGRSLDDVCG